MAIAKSGAVLLWLPAGVALAALLVFGYEIWPGIWLGAFAMSLTMIGSVTIGIVVGCGNTLEALAAAYLINRFANGRNAVDSTKNIFKFAIFAGVVSSTVGATIGVASLVLGGLASSAYSGPIWLTWWMSDGLGAILAAPFITLLWASQSGEHWNWTRFLEAVGVIASVVAVGLIVFGGFFASGNRRYPLEFVCVPFLVWAAFKFGQREASAATLALSITAAWATLHPLNFSLEEPSTESILMLQIFLSVMAVFTMTLAAAFSERRRVEEQARFLAASDPLTGLGNYRNLFDALNSEIKRSDRTRRPFAFLLMDMDGLKQINDQHGHLAGDRALCRLAQVLQSQCRELDTAARYGGDEFALVIPEAGADAALRVATRIHARLAGDGEFPRISVSIGMAVFPQDGKSIDTLLLAADRDLYDLKVRPISEVGSRKFRASRSKGLAIPGFGQIKSQTRGSAVS
jgi:diguanylate cyclase (GGDEF)-like protein